MACTGEFKGTKAWQERDAENKSLEAEFRNIYSWLEYKRERYSDLIDQLEEDTIELNGLDIPDVDFLSFEENEKIWYGVSDYLAKTMPQLGQVKKALDEIHARKLNGTVTPEDGDHAKIIQAIYLNVQAAQLIYRRLERLGDFRLKLKLAKEKRVKERLDANA